MGPHAIKVGADLRYARNLRVPSDNNRTGILYFGTGPTSNPNLAQQGGLGFASFVLGDVTNFKRYVSTSSNAKEFQKRDFFYVQDTWRATPKLTLNLGLRYEFYFPETINGPGNGALLDPNTGYLNVAETGTVASNMNWGRPDQCLESAGRHCLSSTADHSYSWRLRTEFRPRRIRFHLRARRNSKSARSFQSAGDHHNRHYRLRIQSGRRASSTDTYCRSYEWSPAQSWLFGCFKSAAQSPPSTYHRRLECGRSAIIEPDHVPYHGVRGQ